ncbi:hypothetical protein PG997_013137 [Apiospora hydei]|uniref:Uncharacterized protein n=1 Tax=Apiospora hydei TaxID=1337664 RepID=A0ABR1V5D3_9PEZI
MMSRLALGMLLGALLTTTSGHPIQVNEIKSILVPKTSVSAGAFPPDRNIQEHQKRGSVFSGHGLVFGPSAGRDDDLASPSSITGDYGLVVTPGKVQKADGLVVSQTVEVGGVPYKVSGEISQCRGEEREREARLPGRSFAVTHLVSLLDGGGDSRKWGQAISEGLPHVA